MRRLVSSGSIVVCKCLFLSSVAVEELRAFCYFYAIRRSFRNNYNKFTDIIISLILNTGDTFQLNCGKVYLINKG